MRTSRNWSFPRIPSRGVHHHLLARRLANLVFAAIWIGFYIARGITIPIEKLAEGTRAVSEGELGHQVDVRADGGGGILVDAFNNMTRELLANKKEIEAASEDLRRSSSEIDRRRRYMEALLENIGTGLSRSTAGVRSPF